MKNDGFHTQSETAVRPIVIAREKICTLGDAYVMAEANRCQIIDPTVFA